MFERPINGMSCCKASPGLGGLLLAMDLEVAFDAGLEICGNPAAGL